MSADVVAIWRQAIERAITPYLDRLMTNAANVLAAHFEQHLGVGWEDHYQADYDRALADIEAGFRSLLGGVMAAEVGRTPDGAPTTRH